jgi:hypothetical protein
MAQFLGEKTYKFTLLLWVEGCDLELGRPGVVMLRAKPWILKLR